MEALLTFLFQEGKKVPLIVVLDEYPYLRNSVGRIDFEGP